MATVSAKVFSHHFKEDGSANVKIAVGHKRVTKYIDTPFYVSKRQVKKDLELKDPFIIVEVNKILDAYRLSIGKLGEKLEYFTAQDVKDYLVGQFGDIDFLDFIQQAIDRMRKEAKAEDKLGKGHNGKGKSADNFRTVRNSLIDYFGREKVSIKEITVSMLEGYESYLKSKRRITRLNQFGRPVTTDRAPLSKTSMHCYMRDIRRLFNSARKTYNKKSLGIERIKHYPFEEYALPKPGRSKKRNIPGEAVAQLMGCPVKPDGRAELAKECFLLVFIYAG